VSLLAAAALVAGCDVGSIRRSPQRSPSPLAVSASAGPIAEVRRARVPIPMDFTPQSLTFVDSTRGYALYTKCQEGSAPNRSCAASLIATVDGGRTWSVRRHPQPYATDQQMVVSDSASVMLLAEPYGWYLSRDGGLTFRRTGSPEEPPDDYYTLPGRFQIWRWGDGPGRLVEYLDRHRRDVPVQPPLAGGPTDVKYDEAGRLWATGLQGGRVQVAMSRDDGRTWQRQQVPGPNAGLVSARLEISPGAGDVWLLAETAPSAFPRLWLFDGAGWVEQAALGAPRQVRSVVAVGRSVLAVSELGSEAGLVVPPRYSECDWPIGNTFMRVLFDGTLLSEPDSRGEVFLGLGHGVDRRWVQVVVLQT
jgi:hypothetical protein